MVKKLSNKLIGIVSVAKEQLKPQFEQKDEERLYFLEVYLDKEVGVKVKIINGRKGIFKFCKGMRKAFKKSKTIDWDKPVDTSKWVNPDIESIRRELIKNIAACLLLKEDSINYNTHRTKVDLCYSILHSHSPKNPQSLTNFHITDLMETLQNECKTKHKSFIYKILFGKDGKADAHKDMDKCRSKVKEYQEKLLKKMVIKDGDSSSK